MCHASAMTHISFLHANFWESRIPVLPHSTLRSYGFPQFFLFPSRCLHLLEFEHSGLSSAFRNPDFALSQSPSHSVVSQSRTCVLSDRATEESHISGLQRWQSCPSLRVRCASRKHSTRVQPGSPLPLEL